MNILLVPSSYAPKVGGLETAVAHLAAELVSRGHGVSVVTNRYPRTLPAFERINGIPVHRILFPDPIPGRKQLPRLAKYLLGVAIAPVQLMRLAWLIRKIAPTITNIHYLGIPAVYTRLANTSLPSTPLVLSVHGSDLTTVPFPTGHTMLSRYVVSGVRTSTACSANMAEFLGRMMSDSWHGRIVVTGNGVEPSEFKSTERFEHPRPYLFAAAHFTPKKGLDTLIRATKNLIDAGYDIDLILAGSGPLEGTLRRVASELQVDSRVRFWGIANRREMAALLKGCALFVLPSLWEGFGIVSLEAMVCGKAVVASRCGGIPEVVRDGETGLLVPPGDVTAMSEAIAVLLSDPGRREALARRGREVAVRDFSWSAVTDRYLQAYGMALHG